MAEPAFNYANLLFSHLISSGNVEQVYKNSQAVILKNKNVGGNCI